jgi:hypothetical protein
MEKIMETTVLRSASRGRSLSSDPPIGWFGDVNLGAGQFGDGVRVARER